MSTAAFWISTQSKRRWTMSKIRYNNQSAHIAIYEMVLQEKITEVCRKICFDDSQISWVIFDAESFYSSKIASSVLVGTRGRDYGFFVPDTHEIWISTKAIQMAQPKNTSLLKKSVLPNTVKQESDFLADVLLDEITHFQTGANHGEAKYDRKLRENYERYYYTYLRQSNLKYVVRRL